MFVFTAINYLQELQRHRPDIFAAVQKAWHEKTTDLGFILSGKDAFASSPSDSIDYVIMQVTSRAAMVPEQFGWSDAGSWDSL